MRTVRPIILFVIVNKEKCDYDTYLDGIVLTRGVTCPGSSLLAPSAVDRPPSEPSLTVLGLDSLTRWFSWNC